MSTPDRLIANAKERLEQFRRAGPLHALPPVRATRDPSLQSAAAPVEDPPSVAGPGPMPTVPAEGFTGIGGAGGSWEPAPPPPRGARRVPAPPAEQTPGFLERMTQGEPDQRLGLSRYANPLLAKHVAPIDYPESIDDVAARHTRDLPWSQRGGNDEADPVSEDAWRMYLGQPQKYGSLEPSPYRPTRATDPDAVYYRSRGLLEGALKPEGMSPDWTKAIAQSRVRRFVEAAQSDNPVIDMDGYAATMALRNATVGTGVDERGHYLSVYDVFDLDVPGERGGQGFGRPFEIYDRIYYDPETFDPIPER